MDIAPSFILPRTHKQLFSFLTLLNSPHKTQRKFQTNTFYDKELNISTYVCIYEKH